jgi:hypothetical protein
MNKIYKKMMKGLICKKKWLEYLLLYKKNDISLP